MKKLLSGVSFYLLTVSLWAGPIDREIDQVLGHYFKIHQSLAGDSTSGIDNSARAIAQLASGLKVEDTKLKELVDNVSKGAQAIQGKELEQARQEFFELSKPLLAYLYQFYSGDGEYFRFYCSMAKKGWIQPGKDIRNPYYGSSMLTCGELIQ